MDGWMDKGTSDVSLYAHISHTNTHTCTSQGTRGQNKGLRVLTQILKAQLLDLPGLPILISLLSPLTFPISAFYPLPPFLPLSLHHPSCLTISSLLSFYLCLSFITHCLTIIHSIQSTLSLHILSSPAFTAPLYKSSHLPVCVCQGVSMLLSTSSHCVPVYISLVSQLSSLRATLLPAQNLFTHENKNSVFYKIP